MQYTDQYLNETYELVANKQDTYEIIIILTTTIFFRRVDINYLNSIPKLVI